MNDSLSAATHTDVEDGPCEVPRAAANRLAYLLVTLGGQLQAMAEETLAAVDMDDRDYSVLAILTVDGPGTQHEIARLLGKAPGVVVAAIDQLEAKGYVERQRDPADRRRSRVTPTPAGRAALAKADTLADNLAASALSGLNKAELQQLNDLLKQGLALND